VLATSRAALNLRGEYQYPVAPLAVPDGDGAASARTVLAYPAAALFAERAGK